MMGTFSAAISQEQCKNTIHRHLDHVSTFCKANGADAVPRIPSLVSVKSANKG